jgi:Dual specificity phosphatase, catalytic domain
MAAFPQFPNSYWVAAGMFAAGEYPGSQNAEEAAAKLAHLIQEGIDLFIDLTQNDELEPYDHILAAEAERRGRRVAYLRMPIRDMKVPSREEMVAILNAIDSALAAGQRIYVHCWGGVGRTGTVVGCHLVRHGLTGAEALERVATLFGAMAKSAYRRSPETKAQCTFVREWNESSGRGEGAAGG